MKNIRNWMLFAMVLLFFDVHIGIVNLLPNWAGYLILAYCAKKMMAEKGGLTAALGICVAVLRLGYRHFAAAGKRRSMDPAKNIIDVVCHFHCSLRYDAECKTNVHPCGCYDVLCQTLFSVWDLAFDSERRTNRTRGRKRGNFIRKRYSWNP
ncbi:hypothetical protein [Anaerotignum lactatifermentans]|uniref:hypothetical protein n=1 Tax=Anaerotignum lactatifermentans TaxID=160404 RepID=UPI003080ECC1